jgi:hypothetical protein
MGSPHRHSKTGYWIALSRTGRHSGHTEAHPRLFQRVATLAVAEPKRFPIPFPVLDVQQLLLTQASLAFNVTTA